MIPGWCSGMMWAALGLVAAGAVARGGDDQETKPSAETPKPEAKASPPAPSIADRFAQIRAEYDAQQAALFQAMEKAKTPREENALYEKMAPDAVAFSRRMVELAASNLADPGARDALVWVLNFPGRADWHAYGDEFGRAAALLARHHGDDPEAIRAGLGLHNVLSFHRDSLLNGFLASAKGREAKGLARLAMAQYLEAKARGAALARKIAGRRTNRFEVEDDEGKIVEKKVIQSDEEYAYWIDLRRCDPEALRSESERLYEEVIAEYTDVPYITLHRRELEALLGQPTPTRYGRPLTDDERRQIGRSLANKKTLGQVAEERLDSMRNLVEGKPAPEIDGVDFDGKPLKLSSYRGKVVVLVFWGTWCGPCMDQVPHERELAERYKDKPFALLGVDCMDKKDAAIKTMQAEKITWPNWHDGEDLEGPITKLYHIRGYPTCFVLDSAGVIRHKNVLGKDLDKAVADLLAEQAAKAPR